MDREISFDLCENRLTAHVLCNVNSDNAPRLQKALEAACREQPHTFLEIDLTETQYLSSAGLRVILSAYQREKRAAKTADFYLVSNVQPSVYETFTITGFTDILPIKRALRHISLEGARQIGSGFTADVYRIDEENILKLYNPFVTDADMQREIKMAKYALLLGVPTAISYDIVEAEGRRGAIFEMMNCGLLRDAVRDDPGHMDDYLDQYAELLRHLHSLEDSEHRLPDGRQWVFDTIEKIECAEKESLLALARTIPENDQVMHGDCHIKNIMLHNEGLVLIDLDTLSRGDAVIELGNIYYAYTCFEEVEPGNTEEFFGISIECRDAVLDGLFKRYFKGLTAERYEAELAKVRVMGYLRMMYFLLTYRPDQLETINATLDRLTACARKVNTLRLEEGLF